MAFENLNFLIKLIIIILFILCLSLAVAQLTAQRLSIKIRIQTSCLGAVLLTLFTGFFLLGHSLIFKQEAILSATVSQIKFDLIEFSPGLADFFEIDKNFVDSNFIFVNTRDDITTVPFGYVQDSTSIAITDRQKLTRLFRFIKRNQNFFDVIACDLVFDKRTPYDEDLYDSLKDLEESGKLLLAHYPELVMQNRVIYSGLDPSVYGEVLKVINEPLYYSSNLLFKNEQTQIYSFPYQMYLKLNQINEKETTMGHLFKNNITEFVFTDEDSIYKFTELMQHSEPKITPGPEFSDQIANLFTLGELVKNEGQRKMLQKINGKGKNHKSILFIGNVNDEYIDRHETAAGTMNGATLMLNEFYYYQHGFHKMGMGKLFLFYVMIFSGFFWILIFILYRADREDLRSLQNLRNQYDHQQNRWRDFKAWLGTIFSFVVDESHYLMLLIMVLLLDIGFHKIINIMGLIYILPLFSALLKYYIGIRNRSCL